MTWNQKLNIFKSTVKYQDEITFQRGQYEGQVGIVMYCGGVVTILLEDMTTVYSSYADLMER